MIYYPTNKDDRG
jgi:hypothetical protein